MSKTATPLTNMQKTNKHHSPCEVWEVLFGAELKSGMWGLAGLGVCTGWSLTFRVTLDKSVSAKLDYFHLKNQASKS